MIFIILNMVSCIPVLFAVGGFRYVYTISRATLIDWSQ